MNTLTKALISMPCLPHCAFAESGWGAWDVTYGLGAVRPSGAPATLTPAKSEPPLFELMAGLRDDPLSLSTDIDGDWRVAPTGQSRMVRAVRWQR